MEDGKWILLSISPPPFSPFHLLPTALRPLLDHLALSGHPARQWQWQDWHITKITGGFNNILHRATGPAGDFAIKFTIRDSRNRAWREYGALWVLPQAGLPIAPRPVLLDHRSYAQPVVVQTWLEGDPSATPPTTDADWDKLLAHYTALHTLTPDQTDVSLLPAVLTADSPAACKSIVRQQVAALPPGQRLAALDALVHRFEAASFPKWPAAPTTLCHVDANIRNFIRRPGRWAAVDWENAGWGDPAFEIANLMTHPAYISLIALQVGDHPIHVGSHFRRKLIGVVHAGPRVPVVINNHRAEIAHEQIGVAENSDVQTQESCLLGKILQRLTRVKCFTARDMSWQDCVVEL